MSAVPLLAGIRPVSMLIVVVLPIIKALKKYLIEHEGHTLFNSNLGSIKNRLIFEFDLILDEL